MTLVSSEEFSDITSLLSVGKADTHGGPSLKQLKDEYRFDVVIDLNDKKSEAKAAGRLGLKYIGRRTPFVPTPSALEELSKTIDKEVRAEHRVYIHCHRGIYRAPTIAVGYLIFNGMKTDEAVKRVRDRRPTALPGIENSQKLVPLFKTFENNLRNNAKSSK